jgi:hypothetical protein
MRPHVCGAGRLSNGSAGGYIEPIYPEKWEPLPLGEYEFIISKEQVARLAQKFISYWSIDEEEPTDG